MSEKDMAQRIKDLRISQHLTLEQVANKVGVGKSTVRKWETGMIANMRRDIIASLAKALNTTPAYLMGWEDDQPDFDSDILKMADNLLPISKKRFPLLGNVACGKPVFADEELESYIESGTSINADFCLRAKGDSMIGARIHDGDIVFVRKQSMVDNGEIAVVIIDNEATLKRVSYYPDKNLLILKPENPNYQDYIFSDEQLDSIVILGKAVAFQSDVK